MATSGRWRGRPARRPRGRCSPRALETLRAQEALETHNGATSSRCTIRSSTRRSARAATAPTSKVRAVVRVATSMEPVLAEVRRIGTGRPDRPGHDRGRRRGAGRGHAPGGGPPDRALGERGPAGRRGRLRTRASAGSQDEIGQLGAAFNDMTGAWRRPAGAGPQEHRAGDGAQNLQDPASAWSCSSSSRASCRSSCRRRSSALLGRRTPTPRAGEEDRRGLGALPRHRRLHQLSEQIEPRRLNQLVQTYFSSYLELIRASTATSTRRPATASW